MSLVSLIALALMCLAGVTLITAFVKVLTERDATNRARWYRIGIGAITLLIGAFIVGLIATMLRKPA